MSGNIVAAFISGASAILGFLASSILQGCQQKRQNEFELKRISKQFEIDSLRESQKMKTEMRIDLISKIADDLTQFIFVTDPDHYVHQRDYTEALQLILRIQLFMRPPKKPDADLNTALNIMLNMLTGMIPADKVLRLEAHAHLIEMGRQVLESLENQ